MAAEALTASLCQAGDRRNSESKELNQEEARKHQESKWGEQQLWRSVLVPSASQIHDRLSFTLLSEERWRQLCLKESLLTYQTTYLETFNPILCPAKGVPCSSVIRIAIKQKLLGVFLKSTDVRTMERCNYKRETQIWFTFLFLALTLAEEISENQTRGVKTEESERVLCLRLGTAAFQCQVTDLGGLGRRFWARGNAVISTPHRA